MSLKQTCVLFLFYFNTCLSQKNNVCKNFKDYANMEKSKNCWYNPDVLSTPEKLAKNHGFEFQNHSVVTEDGYFLTIFRVQDQFSSERKQPILLHHGLLVDATCFMTSGKRSLAFYLAKDGYDVWLANHRGNNFSPGHTHLNMSNPKFWDFSFHEIGIYDVPAVLEYIAKETGNFSKIIYIGHSMGTTACFIYASLKSEHAQNYLKGFVAMSPLASMKFSLSPFKSVALIVYEMAQKWISENKNVLFYNPEITRRLLFKFCRRYIETCIAQLNLINGQDQDQLTAEEAMVALSYNPTRTPLKCITHYLQIFISQRFQQYDYDTGKNLEMYNSVKPPAYPLSQIKIPVHMFYALNDHFMGPEDALWIFNELTVTEKSMTAVPKHRKVKFTHLNFLHAKDIENYLYEPLIGVVRDLENTL